ncbi:hypothetical protein BDA99DRAFT_320801 [Phascolomyces articulosus]|uniref:Uncharacterized protein n=1 Tax=Phascolomyces articulosus TaxID=60185 RepID=A0AAD5PG72_9FUNG|nr:hypothetical protein BDA99DRAFT_320801 [Phascolomyces articulosus]
MPGNNHKQKPSDRRDSLKQQQRKNSAGKKKENVFVFIHFKMGTELNTLIDVNLLFLVFIYIFPHYLGKQKEYQQSGPGNKTSSTHANSNNSNNSNNNNTNRANTPPIVPAPVPAPVTPHTTGVNGFNSAEVVQFLNQRFSDTLTAYHDTNAEASTRPIKYESQEKAWGNKGGLPSVWGQKNGTMATGADLFTELLKPQQQ